jgi:hypothetical protein
VVVVVVPGMSPCTTVSFMDSLATVFPITVSLAMALVMMVVVPGMSSWARVSSLLDGKLSFKLAILFCNAWWLDCSKLSLGWIFGQGILSLLFFYFLARNFLTFYIY